jgi:Rrf2 family protein
MRLTSASVYALRALAYLARREGDGPVSSSTIAAAAGLSEVFLLKSLRPLVAAGVLRSEPWRGGGFCLARPARDLTLLEVIEAVEGPVRGRAPGVGGLEGARLEAELQEVCDAAAEAVRRRLRTVSLADLAEGGEP